jgi:LPLT family lysophospholipid transporter-like MFS transporter
MPLGFYTIMAAQFFSSLADNALLIAAISLLMQLTAPDWMPPMLKFVFSVSYVLFAAVVGAFADSMPKGKVMLITNMIKIAGCLLIFTHEWWSLPIVDDYVKILLGYAVVGFGAAAYSPAKYGILTEYLPHHKLVIANGWIEGLTVVSIILGTVFGGALVSPAISAQLLAFDVPVIDTGIDTPGEAAIVIIVVLYLLAALFNVYIPNTGVDHKIVNKNPVYLIGEFFHCVKLLWSDKLGQISLAITTLFWGAGATLQFIVLQWAKVTLGYDLSHGTYLQGVCAAGVIVGAAVAAKLVPLRRAVNVIPMGILMGMIVIVMILVQSVYVAVPLIVLIGALSGFFVVPMNALLQHRGHILMGAGHSIAVQNFNENLSILVMIGVYSLLIALDLSIYVVIALFGTFISLSMWLVRKRHLHNLASGPMPTIPDGAHH